MNLSFDPLIGTEIIDLLGMSDYEVENPKKYQQLRDVVSHFQADDNRRYSILKILNGKHGDKLDVLWTYVQLQNEKTRKLQTLNTEDFEPDVAAELTKGYITKDKIKTVKDDIAARKKELQRKQAEESRFDKQVESTVGKALKDLEVTDDTLTEIELINNDLEYYG